MSSETIKFYVDTTQCAGEGQPKDQVMQIIGESFQEGRSVTGQDGDPVLTVELNVSEEQRALAAQVRARIEESLGRCFDNNYSGVILSKSASLKHPVTGQLVKATQGIMRAGKEMFMIPADKGDEYIRIEEGELLFQSPDSKGWQLYGPGTENGAILEISGGIYFDLKVEQKKAEVKYTCYYPGQPVEPPAA